MSSRARRWRLRSSTEPLHDYLLPYLLTHSGTSKDPGYRLPYGYTLRRALLAGRLGGVSTEHHLLCYAHSVKYVRCPSQARQAPVVAGVETRYEKRGGQLPGGGSHNCACCACADADHVNYQQAFGWQHLKTAGLAQTAAITRQTGAECIS